MTPKPEKILFTGDFLRPAAGTFRPTQHENIRWLAHLLDVPVRMATGLASDIVVWDDRWKNQALFDKATIESIYNAFWLEPGIESWPQVYSAQTLPGPVEALLTRIFRGSFVIGFEMPPMLVHFLHRQGIAYVDCALSPVRFMNDLLFGLSASGSDMLRAMQPHGVPRGLQELEAGIVSAHVAKLYPDPPLPNSLLVVMQTSYDKALIEGRRFVDLLDHLEELKTLAMQYSNTLIKHHPIEPQHEICNTLLRCLPNASLTEENFYRLVAHPNVDGVAALSSSCVHEAGYFGKRQHILMAGVDFETSAVGSDVLDIGDAIMMPDFWRDVLAAANLDVTEKDGLSLPSKPNRFRLQHRTAWGYNQIDTDIAVAWAHG